MKKFYKISAIAIIVGVVLFVTGMTMVGWDFTRLDREELTCKEYTYSGDHSLISSLSFKLGQGKVKLVRSDTLKIVYYDSEFTETKIVDPVSSHGDCGDSVSFEQSYARNHWLNTFTGLRRSRVTCEVHIPTDLMLSLSITTKNGSITAANVGDFLSLDLRSTNAKISLASVSATNIVVSTKNGAISIRDTEALKLDVKTSNAPIGIDKANVSELSAENDNAHINLTDSKVLNRASLNSSNGKIEVIRSDATEFSLDTSNNKIEMNEVGAAIIEAESSNGKIVAKNVSASERIRLKTDNNGVDVSSIEAPSISLTTSNGSICGTIKGDKSTYNIDSHCNNGHNNLSNQTAIGQVNLLYARTSNGKISLSFV